VVYARVVVDVAPAHLDRPFDYRVPEGEVVGVGSRVRVDFAGRRRVGWVVGTAAAPTTDPDRVRDLVAVDGPLAWFDAEDLPLHRWIADRWAGTHADVLRHALPKRLVSEEQPGAPASAPPPPLDEQLLDRPAAADRWAPYDAAALLAAVDAPAPPDAGPAFWLRPLGDADVAALAARHRAFLRGRNGGARLVVGERGAVLHPLRDLGLVLVDDEANPAYKERRAPRHHARDVALARARRAGAAAVLLGDLPSANLWRLLADGHVTAVAADRATERRHAPRVTVVDRGDPRPGAQRTRFSDRTASALTATVRAGGAAVVVAARGGQGSALACQRCRTRLACPVCAGSVRPRRPAGERPVWECPACTWDGRPFACPECGDERSAPLAAGAGRLAQELARSHPEAEVARMEGFDAPGPTDRPAIGVMTRGSAVTRPGWLAGQPAGAVVLPDADAFVGRPSMDAAEDGLRLWFAVARWAAGDDASQGVLLQTREPAHPAVQALVRWDPVGFWEREAPRRAELRYPPAASLLRLSAPPADARAVVAELRAALPAGDTVLGPDPGGAALVKTGDLRGTLAALLPLRHAWSKADRKVRLDVDPTDAD
jgi:primosomal protein N' (replication factor Y) (superfamily II helicase)